MEEEEEGFVFVRPLAEALSLSLFLLRFKGSLEGSVQRERERKEEWKPGGGGGRPWRIESAAPAHATRPA